MPAPYTGGCQCGSVRYVLTTASGVCKPSMRRAALHAGLHRRRRALAAYREVDGRYWITTEGEHIHVLPDKILQLIRDSIRLLRP